VARKGGGNPAGELFVRWPGSREVLALLADKWTIPVLHALARGAKRTGELRQQLSGVSQKMLTQTLRRLESAGVVHREVFPVVPPKVVYSLTPLGESLNQPLAVLCRWVEQNGHALVAKQTDRSGK
jgi:DNA-binding HxlR family transcriptional regulator